MTLSQVRSHLAELDLQPSKTLGQNFLHDQNLARWIADAAVPCTGSPVVEIGPGLGAITEYLHPRSCPLILIERDRRLAEFNQRNRPDALVFREDAAKTDLRQLYGGGPVYVAGNLPYSASTAIIERFAGPVSPARQMTFTVQLEVGQRLAARPGTKEFGALTVLVGARWCTQLLRTIPPSVFYPEPKVESAVIRLTRRPTLERHPCDLGHFRSIVRRGFSERRKQLRKLLGVDPFSWDGLARMLGFSATARAEELDVPQWERLSAALHPVGAAQDACESFDEVDEGDRVVRPRPRGEIHSLGLRHRAVHLLVQNAAGEIFLHKRSPWKDKSPELWDSSAAGHVSAGESYDLAARREAEEELGVRVEVERVGSLPCSELTGNEFVAVYRASHEGPFHLSPMEIETGAWFAPAAIAKWIRRSPQDFSPVFVQCFELLQAL